ncbi:MAG: hypothetical protein L6R48_05680 [Planctomycetes bacterium]|nr:hypothetical protein [Planctomycetota bacterium]
MAKPSRPSRTAPGGRSWHRHPVVVVGVIVLLVGVSLWLNWPRPPRVDLPRLDAQALASLGGEREDRHQLLVHLSAQLYRDGRLMPWTALPEVSRPLWTTLNFELDLDAGSVVLQGPPREGAPTVMEAADGYQTLGAPALATLLRDLVPQFADAAKPGAAAKRSEFDRRYQELLPQAQQARLAYIRAHADEIAGR